jgi:glucosamine--fructose-6-phosphate aminotransferase (isomerizing)
MGLKDEILEQPAVWRRLLDRQSGQVALIAAEFRRQQIDQIFLAARGTSDNAGRYAQYLWGAQNGLPVALAAPSLFTLYRPPRLRGALVVGISQSGESPDIVAVLEEGRRQNRPTLAITNEPDSPLARIADYVIDVQAGEETAVAATKTYTASLMAVAMLSAAWSMEPELSAALASVPNLGEQALQVGDRLAELVKHCAAVDRCVVLGRGFQYATAFEWALKLKELAYVLAEPYSSADFQHGPLALVERGFSIFAVATGGEPYAGMFELLSSLHQKHAANLVVLSDQKPALALAQSPIALPPGIPEWVSPLVSILPAQLFTYYLTVEKGWDTESPRTISKVTYTV